MFIVAVRVDVGVERPFKVILNRNVHVGTVAVDHTVLTYDFHVHCDFRVEIGGERCCRFVHIAAVASFLVQAIVWWTVLNR